MPAKAHPHPAMARVLSLGRCRNLFRLLSGVAVCLVSAVSLWAQVIGPIKAVKHALWTGVREDGLHFVLECIDAGVEHSESRRAFWTAFCEEEFRAERDYRAFFEKADASMKARLPLKYESGNWNAWDGLSGFQANLQEPHARNELWVAFVTSKPVESAGKVTGPEVEMYVSVASVKGSPMLMNMGIQRGFQYLVQATRNLDDPNHRCHRNLALSLHSFVAQVMAEREPGLLYMITKPVDRMRELLLQALPRDTFHGCTYSQAQEAYYQAGTPSAEWLELDQEYARLMGAATSACSDLGQMNWLIKPLEQAPQRDEGRLEVLKILQRSIDAERTRLVDQARRVLERQAQQRLLEISRLAEAIQVRPDGTPIAISRYPEEVIRIHGRSERSDKVFEWNRTTRTIHVGGRTLVGDDTKAYDWFVQSIMGGGHSLRYGQPGRPRRAVQASDGILAGTPGRIRSPPIILAGRNMRGLCAPDLPAPCSSLS